MSDNGRNHDSEYEYLIIGGGPAGLQMAYYLQKAGRSYLVLEAGETAGTFFKTFPRHRKLISINKVYTGYEENEVNLRWDWNSLLSDDAQMLFKHYSQSYFPNADDLLRYLSDYASHHKLNITYGVKVENVTKEEVFIVRAASGVEFRAKRLIVSTGVSKEYI